MKKSRFSPEQIAKILKDYDNGITSEELCRLNGISRQTFYKWRSKYAGMESADLKRLKQLEEENGKLKRMYANLALDLEAAKYIIEKKL
jgi:putative transposase